MPDSTGYNNEYLDYFIQKNNADNPVFRDQFNRFKTTALPGDELSFISSVPSDSYHLQPQALNQVNSHWITAVMIISFILITLSKAIFQRKFNLILKSIYNNRNFNSFIKEINIFNEIQSLLLFISYILNFSLLLYFLTGLYGGQSANNQGFHFYLKICLVFTLANLSKFLIVGLSGAIFKTASKTHEYLSMNVIFGLISGIFLLPFLVVSHYSVAPYLIVVYLVLLGIIYLYQLFKNFFIGATVIKFSRFHLFIYLCTLEILPVVILIKLFLINYK